MRGAMIGVLSLFSFLLVLPLNASADVFPTVNIAKRPEVILLTVKAYKPDTLYPITSVVPKNESIQIKWESDATQGCYSDFKSSPTTGTQEISASKSGSVTGEITKTRTFTVTCFGAGVSKTASVKVTVGEPRLTLTNVGIVKGSLSPKFNSASGKQIPNTYIGGQKMTLTGSVKNIGTLNFVPPATGASTHFDYSSNGGSSWTSLSTKPIGTIAPKSSQVVTYEHTNGIDVASGYQFRFCFKVGASDTCSVINKTPFKFVQ